MDNVSVQSVAIKDFLNHEVKSYAQYVLRTRALPSLMDGMRVGARKILWSGLNGTLGKRKNKDIKLPTFIGESMSQHYNHGDNSIKNTIEQLASKHVFQYCPFEIIGQISSLRSGPINTAARYLNIKSTDNLDLFSVDTELLTPQYDEGDKIEPKFLLPIIPMLLLYRTNSPGFGFSFRCMSYNLDSIIDNCIQSIINGSCQLSENNHQLIPEINEIKPENLIYNQAKDTWYNCGEYIMDFNNNQLIITDLPYTVNLPAFEEHLNNLCDKAVIKTFKDFSMDGKIKYVIDFYQNGLKSLYNHNPWEFFKKFKLVTNIPKDTINCISQNQETIKFFDDAYMYIDEFVKQRLSFYVERKTRTIEILKDKLHVLNDIIKFIELVISGELEVRNTPIEEIRQKLTEYKIIQEVIKIPVSKLTKEEIEDHRNDIRELENQLDYIIRTTPEEMYVLELIELKRKFSEIIPVNK